EEYSAGIVSRASHAPFAKRKKSVQAFTCLSMKLVSMTLSGGSADSRVVCAGICAPAEVPGGRRATDAAIAATRQIEARPRRGRMAGVCICQWRVRGKAGVRPGAARTYGGGQGGSTPPWVEPRRNAPYN